VKVGFIGAGHIARALAAGWCRPEVADPPALAFYDVSPEAAERAATDCGGEVADGAPGLVAAADLVVVAVRPQQVAGVLADVGPWLGERSLVSVAAGMSMERLLEGLPEGAHAGRVMPNVAAALGMGVFLFVAGTLGDEEHDVQELFAKAGDVVRVAEEDFDTATAVAGCMPGILAMLVADFASAGEARGLEPDVARRLAVGGVSGAAAVIAREGDPAAVLTAAATPGGMTAAAVRSLEEHEIRTAVHLAVRVAAGRARELA